MVIEERIATSRECVKRTNACEGQAFFARREGNSYCVLHFPGNEKKDVFESAIKKKIDAGNFNFQGVWFPDSYCFRQAKFDEKVDFSSAVFNNHQSFSGSKFGSEAIFAGATFKKEATFSGATFSKKADFTSVVFHKDADFSSARFEAVGDFRNCLFMERADFSRANFSIGSFWPATFNSSASFYEARFQRANFRVSEFKDTANFSYCSFGHAEFINTSFFKTADFFLASFEGQAYFTSATFAEAVRFNMSTFNAEARFTSSTFNGESDFSHSVLKSHVIFSGEYDNGGFGDGAYCDFRHTEFENPNLVSFHSVTLRPQWFVNVDCRRFEFTDVRWMGNLRREFIDEAVRDLTDRDAREERRAADRRAERRKQAELFFPYDARALADLDNEDAEALARNANAQRIRNRFLRLLSITCRQLAVNAEENHRYDEASEFRFWSMELRRKEGMKARGRLSVGALHSLYRYLSGYGEEIGRAFVILVALWLFFSALYTQVGFVPTEMSLQPSTYSNEGGSPQKLTKAVIYSLEVITLQQPNPRPSTPAARLAVVAERILGPIQVALLALAIRRRFIR
jgi:uncharacterized protein YjbI with pentapeptide repeats